MMAKCPYCDDSRSVCEAHPTLPMEDRTNPRACKCGGAGMPCGLCDTVDEPELPPGFRVTIDTKHGRRH